MTHRQVESARMPSSVTTSLVDAMLATRSCLLDGRESAWSSVRRLSTRIDDLASEHRCHDVIAAAAEVYAADRPTLTQLDRLIAELRRASGAHIASGTALLVDDDPIARSVIRMIAQPYVRTVREAGNIESARAVLAEGPVGLIVLDVELGDRDGRDFLVELRSDPSLDHVPVLVFTSHLSQQVRSECLALGAAEVHAKPPDALALDIAFSSLTGHDDRTTLALLGDEATGFADRKMLIDAVDAAGQGYAIHPEIWTLLAFGPGQAGGTWSDDERARVVEAMREEFDDPTSFLARAGQRLVALLPGTAADRATTRAAGVLSRVPGVPVAVGGSEGAYSSFGTIWPTVRRMMALAQGTGEIVIVPCELPSRAVPQVLLVDDDPVAAGLVTSSLRAAAIQVVHLTRGDRLEEILDRVRPQLLVLDARLPGRSGYDLLAQHVQHPRHSRIPAIVVSAHGDPRQEEHALEMGAADYITKPFEPGVFRARVRRLLKNAS